MAKSLKILVVEDDLDFTEVIKTILESKSYQVVTAVTGEEGLQKVKEENPDLIILDVMLEKTTKGFEIAHRLKNPDPQSEYGAYAHIPILMLTAIHQTTFFRFTPDGEYLPVEEFLEKPIRPEELLKRVEQLLRRTDRG
ncbi:MAG TPA: response regulator [Armatimonadetes bacterium]|nr:response regulator [Armatimonadota bacterium]